MHKKKKQIPSATPSRLAKLQQRYQTALASLQTLGYVLPGTLQKRQYRCGKANCHCRRDGRLHGPYYQWTRKLRGKTVNLSLDPQSARTVRQWIQNNRKLRQSCRQLETLSLAALKATASSANV